MSKNNDGGMVPANIQFRFLLSKEIIAGTNKNFLGLYLVLIKDYGFFIARKMIYSLLLCKFIADNAYEKEEKLHKLYRTLSQLDNLG